MKYIEQTPLARDQERKDRWAIGVTWYISGSRRRQFLEGVEHKCHKSAFEVLRSWDAQRVKYQRLAVQDESYTLQPVHEAELLGRSAAIATGD
jgi:hypothetical protein